jgi:hypothetical protein
MNNLKTGVVLDFIIEKNYGFIKDNETNEKYFFFLDKKEQIQLSREGYFPIAHIRKGDILYFKTRMSHKKDNQKEAYNLIFVENQCVDLIKSYLANGNRRLGVVFKWNDNYYLTDCEIDISFPLKILHKEIGNINFEVLNTKPVIEYFLEQRKNPTKIYAKLKL